MNPRSIALKTFCAVAGGVLTAVTLTAPAIAAPEDVTLPATEALSGGEIETPVENPLLPPESAPVPFAANEYTIGGPSAACTIGTDATGIITVTDAGNGLLDLGFDLGKVPAPWEAVHIPTEIVEGCSNTIRQIVFTGGANVTEMSVGINAFFQNDAANTLVSVVFPEGLTNLDIFEQAFYQYASNEDNTLRDIVFPSSLKTLNIRAGAFSQGRRVYSTGDNALTSVTFPEGLETLSIGDHAFYQIGGILQSEDNALREINFPSTLKELSVGYRTFSQWAPGGGKNALERIDFPEGLLSLSVGVDGFYQSNNSENRLAWVTLPSTLKQLRLGRGAFISRSLPVIVEIRTGTPPGDGANSITLGNGIIAENGRLFWYGATSQTDTVWASELSPGSFDYDITGYRELKLELVGGTIAEMNGSSQRFAYPEGEGHLASFAGLPEYTGVSPAYPFGRHWLILPEPTRADHEFLGWCPSRPVASTCQDASGQAVVTLKSGKEFDLADTQGVPTVLYAVWEGEPAAPTDPNPPTTPPDAVTRPDGVLAATGTDGSIALISVPLILTAALLLLGRRARRP